ncbi:MAG: adenylate/guanylate cyclase domain-containing protein [Planctomycetes bacterium]|nr:adenylate/guanylate cyclase domain-containing protein [Planctomycetota bacterium]
MLNHVLLPVTHSVTYPAMQMRLNKLLAERVKPDSDKQAIDDQIWELFGEEWAVMFTDLAGFSRNTEAFGITHFLQVIYESFRMFIPIIESGGGMLLKVEGDSMLVIFRRPESALRCAIAMQNATRAYNADRPLAEHVLLAVGLGFGRVLKFGDQDVYGQELNVACKLGEDLGVDGAIQCSDNFRKSVQNQRLVKFAKCKQSPRGTKQAWVANYTQAKAGK